MIKVTLEKFSIDSRTKSASTLVQYFIFKGCYFEIFPEKKNTKDLNKSLGMKFWIFIPSITQFDDPVNGISKLTFKKKKTLQ